MRAIKTPVLFGISMLLGLVALCFAIDRLTFLAHAQHTTGTVAAVHAHNDLCSCGRHCSYNCTVFRAEVQFPESAGPRPLVVTAGSARGYDQPLNLAWYGIGSSVPVIYNPRNTNEAYRDTVKDVWGTPIALFFFQIVTLIGSFAQRRSFSAQPAISPSPAPSPEHLQPASNYFLAGSSDTDVSDEFGGSRSR